MNIIWKREDGSIAVTSIGDEGVLSVLDKAIEDGVITPDEEVEIDWVCRKHAQELQDRGDIPSDWEAVKFNYDKFEDFEFREAWVWGKDKIEVDLDKAKDVVKSKIRRDREEEFKKLDIEFMQAIEDGVDVGPVVAKKKKLRDLTNDVDKIKSLKKLKGVLNAAN